MKEILDPATPRHVERAVQELKEQFRGVFSEATVDRFVRESIESLSASTAPQSVPIFVTLCARAPACPPPSPSHHLPPSARRLAARSQSRRMMPLPGRMSSQYREKARRAAPSVANTRVSVTSWQRLSI